jgi:hypothetical protein
MYRFHHITAVLSAALVTLITTGVTLFAADPAFAMRQTPNDDSGTGPAIQVVSHPGWTSWETALIGIGAAVLGALVTVAVLRRHARTAAPSAAR